MSDELGAHVSAAGGVDRAPARAAELDAIVLQLFTKQPSRWAERPVDESTARAFRDARVRHGINVAAAHDSYLINLASPDARLFERSLASFRMELGRGSALGLDYLVTHPGNATDGDRARGIAQNAAALARALDDCEAAPMILLETTAGSGSALGGDFAEIARLLDASPAYARDRLGVCLDTCHLWAAGYDLDARYDDVVAELDRLVGLDRVRLIHLNDSRAPLGRRVDRHAHIGQGTMGEAPFRQLLNDARFAHVPKVIETPKDDDPLAADRANLARLRSYRHARRKNGSER